MSDTSVAAAHPRIRSNAALILSIYGTLWGIVAVTGFEGTDGFLGACIVGIIGAVLVILSFQMLRSERRLPRVEDTAAYKKIMRIFLLINILQYLAIAILVFLCLYFKRFEWIAPSVAMVVAIHFFFLAPLFEVMWYFLVGSVMCLLAILTVTKLPTFSTYNNGEIVLWWVVVGIGSTIVLWLTAVQVLVRGMGLLRIRK